jgi:hypothetical protein
LKRSWAKSLDFAGEIMAKTLNSVNGTVTQMNDSFSDDSFSELQAVASRFVDSVSNSVTNYFSVASRLQTESLLRTHAAFHSELSERVVRLSRLEALETLEKEESECSLEARRILESEERLTEAIAGAEAILNLSMGMFDLERVIEYSLLISSSTSAPPEWRTWKMAKFQILQPSPLLHDVVLPANLDGKSKAMPSMVHCSWLLPQRNEPELPLLISPVNAGSDHGRKRDIEKEFSIVKKHKADVSKRVMAGFSSDEDESS